MRRNCTPAFSSWMRATASEVLGAEALEHRLYVALVNQVGEVHGHTVFAAQVRGQAHILGSQGSGKARLKVSLEQEPRELFGQSPGASRNCGQ